MSRFRQVLLCFAIAAVTVVWACGPFFGIEALQDRSETLLAPPTVSFEAELKGLVPVPDDTLPVVEDQNEVTRAAIESKALPAEAQAKIAAMREKESGDAAYEAGDSLAGGVRQYTAGAVAFLHNQTDQAELHWQTVLTLPAPERKNWELWTHFMLGRLAIEKGDLPAAMAHFDVLRHMVRSGAADPLGVAVASFGEEARGTWKQGLVGETVKLYAEQAAYGSRHGMDSLLILAGEILKDNDLLDKAIEDPLARRLLFISLNKNGGQAFFVGPDGSPTLVDALMLAMQKHGIKKAPGAGLLAAAAYNQGAFEDAEILAHWEESPISEWVKAKLALKRGDREAALHSYELALAGYAGKQDVAEKLQAEMGVLRVSRQEYVEALDLFREADGGTAGFSDYWGDVAYLAERVLTTDELQNYVDKHAIKGTATDGRPDADMELRSVLARRLMREGRRGQALRYFDDPKIRAAAKAYDAALDRAASWWRLPNARARAWFDAATLARKEGLEILGYEREPDWAMWDGNFTPYPGSKPKEVYESQDERKRVLASRPQPNVRFQYRLTAVDESMKAADALPRTSQAFAAVLCQGTSWVIDGEPARAQEVYSRYVHQGPHVPWGKKFGESCPQPDFHFSAVWSVPKRERKLEEHLRAHRALTSAGGGAAVALATAFGYLMVRRRQSMRY